MLNQIEKSKRALAVENNQNLIDVDIPFGAEEVEETTSAVYVGRLTRSDVTIANIAADFCSLGQRNCKRFLKKGACRQEECPLVAAERKKNGRAAVATIHVFDPIDVDMPFSAGEVAALTSEAYVAALGSSDMPNIGRWSRFEPTADAPKVPGQAATDGNAPKPLAAEAA